MPIITTRRHPFKFYAALLFISLLLFGIGSLILFTGINILQKGQPATKDYFMSLFGLAFYLLAFFTVYAYWKNTPHVIIDNYTIKIGDRTIDIKNIKDVALTGKMPFRFILNYPMEGTALLLADDTEIFLFDDMYANSSEIKLFLQQVVLNKQEYKPALTSNISKDSIYIENEETFKGNQFTSFRGLSLWGLIGFLTFTLFDSWEHPPMLQLVTLIVFGIFWFVLHGWLMHYFGLTTDYLIVRNHIFIWKMKIYRLSDIKEVVYETQGKQPNCMRIITKDFRNKLYPAGTLRNKTWLYLKMKLEAKGVAVRNECIS